MALWEGLWEGFEKPLKTLWKPLKASENLWKPLKTSENFWNPPSQRPARRPSQRQISLSEPLRPVAPNRVAPQSFSEQWPSARQASLLRPQHIRALQPIVRQTEAGRARVRDSLSLSLQREGRERGNDSGQERQGHAGRSRDKQEKSAPRLQAERCGWGRTRWIEVAREREW